MALFLVHGEVMKVIFHFIFYAILLIAVIGASRWWADRGKGIESRNPFQFSWDADNGHWRLNVIPGKFESFLLIKKIEPSFYGISPPEIVSSKNSMVFTSSKFKEVVGFSVETATSYARLPDNNYARKRVAVGYPLHGCGHVVQIDGSIESGGKITHTNEEGTVHAVDLKAKMGVAVIAARAGRVVFAEGRYLDNGAYDALRKNESNQVIVLHEDGSEAVYAHLRKSSIAVKEGDFVEIGDKLAEVGNSGFSGGAHLHFQIGGVNMSGYHTIPIEFNVGGGKIVPLVGSSFLCN